MTYEIHPLRWYAKRAARRLVAALSAACARRGASARWAGTRVLTYHRFGDRRFDPVAVRIRDFEQQLEWLLAHVDVLNPDSFREAIARPQPSRRDAVLLTIDDGHRSFFEAAFPLLKTYQVPAVLFVCPALVDAPGRSREFMSWDQIQDVARSGITVASHGNTHVSLGKLSLREAEREILNARARLQQCVRADHSLFAFPFGTRRDFSLALGDILLSHGYRYCFSAIHGPCRPILGSNIFARLKIESGESLDMFRAIALGHLDAWRFVDHSAWWLQQRGRF